MVFSTFQERSATIKYDYQTQNDELVKRTMSAVLSSAVLFFTFSASSIFIFF